MPRSRHEGAAISVSHISPGELLVILRRFSPLSASLPALLSRVDPRRQRSDGLGPFAAKGVQGEGMQACLVAQKLQDGGMRHAIIVTPPPPDHGNYGGINTNIFEVFQ